MNRIYFLRHFDQLLGSDWPPSSHVWVREFGTSNFRWSVRPFSGADAPRVKASLQGSPGNKVLDICVADRHFGKVGALALSLDDALVAQLGRVQIKNFADVRLDLGDGIFPGPSIGREVIVRVTNLVRGSLDASDMDGPLRLLLDFLNNPMTRPNLFTAELTAHNDWVEAGWGRLGNGRNGIPAYNGRDTEIRIDLGNGNDTYLSHVAFASKDLVVGGFGNDKIYAGGGDDLIFGDQDERGFATTLDVKVEIAFRSESADFRNLFGWYDRVTGEARILLGNTDLDTNPQVLRFRADLDLSPEQWRNMEFFLVPDGWVQNPWLAAGDPSELELRVVFEGGRWVLQEIGSGRILRGADGIDALFTQTAKNPHGWQAGHFVDLDGGARDFVLSFEDFPSQSSDFDDAVFSVRTRVESGLPGNDHLNGGAGDDHLWGGQDFGRYALKYLVDPDFDLFGQTYAASDAYAEAHLNEFGNIVVTIGGALQALALLELSDGERVVILIRLTGELYGEANVTITNDFLVDTFAHFDGDVNVEVIPIEDFTGPLVLFNETEIFEGDILFGGSGRDTFWFNDGDGVDVVMDFQRGVDLLKLERGEPIRQTVVTDVRWGRGLLVEHGGDGDAVFLLGIEQPLALVSSGAGYDTYS
ncbi:MAG: hypothetical protein N2038_10805 [Geminicoccaceae bacterium]|nr:hypothetical protein [Geminicoccaceae bacterium]